MRGDAVKAQVWIATVWKGYEFVGSSTGSFFAVVTWAKAQQARGRDYSANISPAGIEV